MEVIRIGTKVINLTAIAEIDLDWEFTEARQGVLVRYIGPGGEMGRDRFFEGAEAEAIRQHFTQASRNLLEVYRKQNDAAA